MEFDAVIRPRRLVLRVDWVDADDDVFEASGQGHQITVRDAGMDPGVEVGAAVFVDLTNSTVAPAPADMLPQETWFSRVVHVDQAEAFIGDANGKLMAVELPDGLDLRTNSVVECRHESIIRVVSHRPFPPPDGLDEEDLDISRFMPPPPPFGFERFYGSPELIERAREFVKVPIEAAEELATINARPIRGVLFSGPPGTGKTLLASLIAKEASATFFRIDGPSVFRRLVGESEGAVRRIFDEARRRAPSIIFFDEIDSLGGRRKDDTDGSSVRVLSALLTSMSEAPPDVRIIGATNRRDVLDEALLRSGRFDWEVRFESPDAQGRLQMLNGFAADLNTSGPLRLQFVAEQTDGWSPADLELIFSEAALVAAKERRDAIVGDDVVIGLQKMMRRRQP